MRSVIETSPDRVKYIKMVRLISLIAVGATAGTVAFADCPMPPDHNAALARLVERAREAPNEAAGRAVSDQMWELWTDAPDAQAQEVLNRGMSRRQSFDLLGSIEDFTTLVEYCPEYAEGYNQRAFAQYLREDYAAALIDLNQALDLSPAHVGVLSGRALTYMQLGEIELARRDLQAALTFNPWLSERHLLAPGGPLSIKGDDI